MNMLARAEAATDRNPSAGRVAAGNYRKGKFRFHGLVVSIENPRGSIRSAKDGSWKVRMRHAYGYILRTEAADGDHVDAFIGPHLKSPHVFVIDQHDHRSGRYDEAKVMLGFASKGQARQAYIQAFSDGKGAKRIGHIEHMTIEAFKAWLRDGNTRKPIKRRADGGRIMLAPEDPYSTPLSLHDEAAYQMWKMQNAPRDSGADYDLRGAYLANMQRDPDNGHMGDRFKKPNHPTFSDQSQYAVGDQASRAGHWIGPEGPDQTFVPPAAMRAAGGRAGYAGGGAPAFDPSKPFDSVDAPAFDPSQPFTPAEPDAGKMDAALRGARAGLTYNFGDEIEGARANAPKWVPEIVGPLPARTMVGAARTGYGYLTGDKSLTDPYEKARDEARKGDEAARASHPYVYAGSELAGAVPAMAALPELGAAKGLAPAARGIARFGARTLDAAVTGGEYGAMSGAGEGKDTADRAVNAASGIVSGIVGGAGGSAAGEAVGAVASRYGAPIVNTVRGWMDPNGEAARRLAGALKSDNEMIMNGTAKGMTVQQWVAAKQAGEPVTLADLGAGRTQALLRSAANTSPEGRAQLEQVIENRFLQQGERVADTVRNALPGGTANARKSADQIVAEYDAGRVPAYKQAYQQGDKPLMSPAMERLMGTDTFVAAMKRAISSGKDRDAVQGLGGFNPMVNVTPDGRIVFNKGAQGIPTYPNLQYWDQVKRELDAVANMAKRSGDNERADLAGNMAKILRTELDRQVPSYANARGVAEKYFGEDNALEAGRKLAGKKMDPEEVTSILRQMKPDERALFQEGYASDLANRVIGSMKDTTNITKGNGLLQSPNERKMAAAIFGPGGVAQIHARMYLETIMDGARQAMGNSTTARQLIEAGLAGGVGAGLYSGWDPSSMATGAAGLAGSRIGASKFLSEEARVGLHHMIGKVDARTARRVAELLTSNDPRDLRAGYQMAAKSNAIMQGLQNMARRIGLSAQTATRRPATETLRALQGTVPGRADDAGRLYVSPNQDDQQKQQRP
jgi:hypothetical protein